MNRTTAICALLATVFVAAACDPMGGPTTASPQINNTPEGEPANATTAEVTGPQG